MQGSYAERVEDGAGLYFGFYGMLGVCLQGGSVVYGKRY